MRWILERLSEGNTHAGLAALAQVGKVFLPPQYHLILDGLSAAFAGGAVAIPERR